MRPTTPIPYGCSLTLLSCQINLEPERHQQQQQMTATIPNKKFSIYNIKNKQGTNRQKHSLKNRNSKNLLRESVSNSNLSNFGQLNWQKQRDRFLEVSSMSEAQLSYRDRKESEKTKPFLQTCVSEDINVPQKRQQQFSQIFEQNKQIKENMIIHNQKFDDHHIFTEEITLNLKTGSHLKERETAHTNNVSQRRVITEENKKQSAVHFLGQRQNKFCSQIYKSELITPDHYRNLLSPDVKASQNNFDGIFSDISSNNPPLTTSRSPAIKKPSYFEVKTSIVEPQYSNHPQIHLPVPRQTKIEQMDFYSGMPKSEATHIRKQSSQKKFHTLIDLQCKNIDSSGGERTSSNHVSIVTSQPSFNNTSARDSGVGDFARVIKLMTLKSLPLSQDLWENMKKDRN